MAEAKTCDNPGCKNLGHDPYSGWLHVERVQIDWYIHGEDDGPWDFCSFECLAVWSAEHVKRGNRRPIGPVTPGEGETLTNE